MHSFPAARTTVWRLRTRRTWRPENVSPFGDRIGTRSHVGFWQALIAKLEANVNKNQKSLRYRKGRGRFSLPQGGKTAAARTLIRQLAGERWEPRY